MELEDTLCSRWDYVSAPLHGQEGEVPLQTTLNFPNSSGWEGPGGALSLGYKLMLLTHV